LWLIPWLIINKGLPTKHPWISEEEKSYILEGQVNASAAPATRTLKWRELIRIKQSYSVIVTRFFLDPIWWMFVSWLPFYLKEKYGFDTKGIGYFAWVPFVGAGLGSLAGGWFPGYYMKKGNDVNRARKLSVIIGNAICLPALLLTTLASDPLIAVLLIAFILFGFQFSMQSIQTLPSDFLSGKSVGSLAGLGGMAAALGVVCSMLIIPEITRISWTPFFIMGAVLVPLGVLSMFAFAGKIRKLDVDKV
jgi:ACS family hexuronate transporter-like MFS transporter